jgi:hypothetical protein
MTEKNDILQNSNENEDLLAKIDDVDSDNIVLVSKEYLVERCNNRKLIICGTGKEASQLATLLSQCDVDVDYFISEKPINSFSGKKVRSCFDIVFEDPCKIFIIVADEDIRYGIFRQQFIEIGLLEDIHFTYYKDVPAYTEPWYFDVTLGYSRVKENMEGFEVFGDIGNPDALVIVALGGSTTESYYSFIKGWAYFLVELFNSDGISVVMYCGGVAGYTSTQELLKLVRDVIPLRPHIVLSYGGFNDLLYYPLNSCPPNQQGEKSGPFAYQSERVLKPFVHHFQVDYMRSISQLYPDSDYTVYYGLQNNKSASTFWFDNVRAMSAITSEFNILFLSFLQPFYYTGHYVLTDSQKTIFHRHWWDADRPNPDLYTKERIISMVFGISEIKTAINNADYITDLTDIFDGQEAVYRDICHVTEQGNEIIAKNIYSKLKIHLHEVVKQ